MTRKTVTVHLRTLAGAAVCALTCVFALVIGQAQQKTATGGVPKLAPEDRFEIQELLHRYMFVLDDCPDHNNGYDYADLYTDDGVFNVGGSTSGGFKGRERLAQAAGRTSDGSCNGERVRGEKNQIHLNVGEIIAPTAEGAKGTSYLMMIDGPRNQIYWAGWYEDTYVKTPKGWRFKSRTHMSGGSAGIPSNAAAMRREWQRMVEESLAKNPPPARSANADGLGRGRGRGPTSVSRDPLNWVDSREKS